jgi:small subunit ribosomal protein S21
LSSARAAPVIKRPAANAQANIDFMQLPPCRDHGCGHCAWFVFAGQAGPMPRGVKLSATLQCFRWLVIVWTAPGRSGKSAACRRGAHLERRASFAFLVESIPIEARPRNIGSPVQVLVRDNNVDQALKALKKKMQREGIFREMKLRGHYEKPSEKRAREKAEAVRRARKLARKKLQREGLLPMKPKVVPGAPRTAG